MWQLWYCPPAVPSRRDRSRNGDLLSSQEEKKCIYGSTFIIEPCLPRRKHCKRNVVVQVTNQTLLHVSCADRITDRITVLAELL
jgi:hypothetical protein